MYKKTLIFFQTKDTSIVLFLVGHYTVKTDINWLDIITKPYNTKTMWQNILTYNSPKISTPVRLIYIYIVVFKEESEIMLTEVVLGLGLVRER